MKPVSTSLRNKPDNRVHTIGLDESVLDAITKMARESIGALLVCEPGGGIVGIVTERDYARKVILKGRASRDTAVREIMTADVMYVSPEHTNEQCMALMTDRRLRHLPVMSGGKLVGLVSIGDLVKDIISEQQFVIDQLQHYIMGDRA